MELIINGHVIDSDLNTILTAIRNKTSERYLGRMRSAGENIAISCPFHKDGQEKHPSCFVYSSRDNDSVPFGFYRCFTCGSQGQLYNLVAYCFGCDVESAKEWLVDNFSSSLSDSFTLSLPKIDLSPTTCDEMYMDEKELDKYSYFHPYMFKRGLSEEVIRKFRIGWNPDHDTITFPIWDDHNNLIGITERSVKTKRFYIPKDIGKPVYLLNFIKLENVNEVYVCESQIDALYLESMGYRAIALLGTGSKNQYEILKKSGIRIYHLALDGDMAGRHGMLKFINNMPDDIIIDVIKLPQGKDVNDLTKEEFDKLEHFDKYEFKKIL